MEFKGDETVAGIDGYMFQMESDTFSSAAGNSDNKCFCIDKTKDIDGMEGCLGDGLLNVLNCQGNSKFCVHEFLN